ncbi:MAG: hypothetical protein JWN73_542 [Betaproteobacteria bacterium]|nr:hypothetical protein [Betaproteobacteria bacterium]
MKIASVAFLALVLAGGAVSAQPAAKEPIETTTPNGEKIRLYPDGHWEYVDQKKAEVQRTERVAEEKKKEAVVQAKTDREKNAQGLLGAKIYPGDPDFNRGSLNPKLR